MLKNLLIIIFKNAFFVMSLSGTVIFAFYLLIYPLSQRYFSLKWRYKLLKIAMVFYLVPFPLCKYYVRDFFYDNFSLIQKIARQNESSVMSSDYIIVVNRDSILLSPKVQTIYIIVLFAVLISFFIIWKQITQYRKMKRICTVDLKESTERNLQELFSRRKAILHIKKDVKFVCSEYCESPITIGVLSPTVLFPIWDKDSQMDDELCEYMITHELVHIKHNDVLIKLAGLLVMAVHWFNPFVYLLYNELSCISEMYCDSVVMDGRGEEERRKYGNLLLKFIVENVSLDKQSFGVGFANYRKKKLYKRRLLEMKRIKKSKAILSVMISVFICMAGGATVFAYEPPATITNENSRSVGTDMFILDESLWPEKLVSDCFAVADDGTVYDLCQIDESDRAVCNHDYFVSVKTTYHKKDGNGGCAVEVYSALKCTRCLDIKLGELLNIVTYMRCPH